MDAHHVRVFLGALATGPASAGRMRRCLAALQRPDIRYLVATVVGEGAPAVAAVTGSIVEAAGAPAGLLGTSATIGGAPLDEALFASAGTLVADAALALDAEGHGALTRREADIALALVAFAQASRRVAILVDPEPREDDPLHAVEPDLVVLARLDGDGAERALARVPDARPVVAGPQDDRVRDRIARIAAERGLPLLLGGRDFGASGADVVVAGERYPGLLDGAGPAPDHVATGVAAALGLGMLGIRMREAWVHAGVAAARATMGP